jgi:phytoene/squalene synthetase
VREPACALYAFCRVADDEVDGGPTRRRPSPACASAWPRSTPAAPPSAWPTAHWPRWCTIRIPPALPEALIEGFAWDAEGRRYETLDDLHAYAARVAGTVGAMMALLMGTRDPAALARACDLGVAMQLSNIARDVGEDAAHGPPVPAAQWLREAGIDPDAWLAAPASQPGAGRVVRRLLDEADRAVRPRVGSGVAELPLACRPGINAARYLYAEIGHEVARRGLDPLAGRAVVSRRRKLATTSRRMPPSSHRDTRRRGLHRAPGAQREAGLVGRGAVHRRGQRAMAEQAAAEARPAARRCAEQRDRPHRCRHDDGREGRDAEQRSGSRHAEGIGAAAEHVRGPG